jgi:hypothetical protein
MNKKSPAFDVGYKRPPVHTRYKPGYSGNPAGRPKKKRIPTFLDAFEKELMAKIRILQDGKPLSITKLQAIVKQHTNKALKGDSKATALIMSVLLSKTPEANSNLSPIVDALRTIHAKHESQLLKPNQPIENSDPSDGSGWLEPRGAR